MKILEKVNIEISPINSLAKKNGDKLKEIIYGDCYNCRIQIEASEDEVFHKGLTERYGAFKAKVKCPKCSKTIKVYKGKVVDDESAFTVSGKLSEKCIMSTIESMGPNESFLEIDAKYDGQVIFDNPQGPNAARSFFEETKNKEERR